MFRPIPLLASTALVATQLAGRVAAADSTATCYDLSGDAWEASSGVIACDASVAGSNSSHSACCNAPNGDACLSTGLCLNALADVSGHLLWSTGCTDPTFSDPSCPQFCVGSQWGNNGNYNLRSCNTNGTLNTWCCANGNDTMSLEECCTQSFKLPSSGIGTVLAQLGTNGAVPFPGAATTTSPTTSNPSSPPASSSPSASPSSTSTSGYIAGIAVLAVLLGLAVLALVVLGFYAYELRKQLHTLDEKTAPGSPSQQQSDPAAAAAGGQYPGASFDAYGQPQMQQLAHTESGTTTTPPPPLHPQQAWNYAQNHSTAMAMAAPGSTSSVSPPPVQLLPESDGRELVAIPPAQNQYGGSSDARELPADATAEGRAELPEKSSGSATWTPVPEAAKVPPSFEPVRTPAPEYRFVEYTNE